MCSPGESGDGRKFIAMQKENGEEMNYEKKRTDEKPVYDDSYDKKLNESYDKIKNRSSFRYSLKNDPMYTKYRNDYISQGKMAMRDTAGRASSLSGGYASSYAETAGQQSYDSYLTKLGDVIPELYQLAYSRYAEEGDRLKDEYELLEGLRDDEYRRYTDALDDYNARQEREYQRRRDEQEDAASALSLSRSDAAAKAKYGDFSGYAALYGDETAEQMKSYWIGTNPLAAYNMGLITAGKYYSMTGEFAPGFELPQPDSTAGSSGSYYPGTAPDGRDAKVVQRELKNMGFNIAVDGAWGPKSQAAWERAYGKSGWISM